MSIKQFRKPASAALAGLLTIATLHGADVNVMSDILMPVSSGDGIKAGIDYDGAGPWPAGTVVLAPPNAYILDEPVFVENGATLIIEPGTRIYATYDDNGLNADPLDNDDGDRTNDDFGSLIVARGGRIEACGTASNPIVFTSIYERDGLDTTGDGIGDGVSFPVAGENHGLWGGVVILGYAHVTKYSGGSNTGIGTIEGFAAGGDTRTLYGADLLDSAAPSGDPTAFDNDDNSGIFQYVSIRFGGYEFAPGEEVNGLTMGGVGRGTQIDHVEVVSNNDDGFEWFGGTVNCSNLAAVFCDDDSFDFDQGFQGCLQFLFAIQTNGALGNGDKLGEHDGRVDGAEVSDLEAERTKPVIFNATYIGSRSDAANSTTGFKLREDFAGQYHNSFFMDLKTGLEIGESIADGEGGPFTVENVEDGYLRFENISWYNIATPTANPGDTTASNGTAAFTLNFAEFALYLGDYDDIPGIPDGVGGSNSDLGDDPGALPIGGISRSGGSGALDPTLPTTSPLWASQGAGLTALPLAYDTATDNLDCSGLAATSYRGAFGSQNWLAGWTYLSEEGYLAASGRVNLLADILAPAGSTDGIEAGVDYDGAGPWPAGYVELDAATTYILDNPLFVEDGATLKIQAGTTIAATYNDNGLNADPLDNDDGDRTNDDFGALVVARGGRIEACGTATEPIVFTSIYELDGLDTTGDGIGDGVIFPVAGDNHGLWGGVVILGYAHVTKYSGGSNTGIGTIEGFASGGDTRTLYGADLLDSAAPIGDPTAFDNDDDSGIFKYVSIRYGGYEFAPGEEVNGLTMGGVGRGTQIDHVEVVSNNDDGFEWFGGTVNCNHLAAVFCDDDSFDFDQGFQGCLQFLLAIQTNGSLGNGDKLGEHDGRVDGAEVSDLEAERTKPVIFNATYIGSRSDAANSTTGFKLREDFAGQYHNSFFMDLKTGLEIGESIADGEGGPFTVENVEDGYLRFENISWFNIATPTANPGDTTASNGTAAFTLNAAEFALYLGDYDNIPGIPDGVGGSNVDLGDDPAALPIASIGREIGSGKFGPTLPAGSPLWAASGASLTPLPVAYDTATDNLDCSGLVAAGYQGAFGADNWLEGWTYLSAEGYLLEEEAPADRPRVEILADILAPAGSTDGIEAGVDYDGAGPWPAGYIELSSATTYVLDNPVFIEDGATLKIEAGTWIAATYNDNGLNTDPLDNDDGDRTNDDFGALVVARGGTVLACGTELRPIVFTSIYELDGLDTTGDGIGDGAIFPVGGENHGLWGGVVILGYAHVTKYSGGSNTGIGTIEGFASGGDTRTLYGADLLGSAAPSGDPTAFNNADNSGIFRYVSIRFGGYEFAPGEEVNGLTMGGVGSGTQIDHVEVVSNNDDGFEWFGGTVNCNHLAAVFCDDDSFDFDQGFQGCLQFLLAIQTNGSLGNGDKLGEHDGRVDGAEVSDLETERTKPVIFNATYIGSQSDSSLSGTGFKLREDFAGQYHNSFFMDLKTGLEIGESIADGEGGPFTVENVEDGLLRFENISWFNVATPTANPGDTTASNGTAAFTLNAAEFALYLGDYDNIPGFPDAVGGSNVDLGDDPADLPIASLSRAIGSQGLDPSLPGTSPLWSSNGASLTSLPLAYDTANDNLDCSGLVAAGYQGAFGASNWLENWTYLAQESYLGGGTVAPASVVITDIGKVDADTIFIAFQSSAANAAHEVKSSANLLASPFTGAVTISGGSLTTDGTGAGQVQIDLGASPLFFQLQLP